MAIKVKVGRMDKRMTGHEYFQYYGKLIVASGSPLMTDPIVERLVLFTEIRNWCIDQWGMSCEMEIFRDLIRHNYKLNTVWCWYLNLDLFRYKFFFISEKEALWFKLRWES